MIADRVYLLRIFILAILVHCTVLGADLAGIWMGQTTARNGDKEDVAFQFKMVKGSLAGVMFGDEADLPIEDLKVEGGAISFAVTTVNYYSGSRLTVVYSGTVTDKEMHLTRQRKGGPAAAGDSQTAKLEIVLKHVT